MLDSWYLAEDTVVTKAGMVFSLQLACNKVKKSSDRQTDTYIARNLTSINEKKCYLLYQLTKDAAAIKPPHYSHPRW